MFFDEAIPPEVVEEIEEDMRIAEEVADRILNNLYKKIEKKYHIDMGQNCVNYQDYVDCTEFDVCHSCVHQKACLFLGKGKKMSL